MLLGIFGRILYAHIIFSIYVLLTYFYTMAIKRKHLWKKIRRGIKYPILLFFIRCFILTIRLLPRNFVLRVFRRLGLLAFRVVKGERLKTIKNIKFAYGDTLTDEQVTTMARNVFAHQALNFADYLHTLGYRTRKDFSKLIDFVGEENLKVEYEKGKGVLCLVSHTGSWEFSAIMPPVMGYETTAVSKALANKKINDLIIGYREKRGMKNISRGKAYPLLIEALAKGECMIIMIDQDTLVKGTYVDFFGKKAFTPIGAARLALDSGSPVVPMFMKRLPNNRHQFTIYPALETIRTGNDDHDLVENTKLYTQVIENIIRETPDQWVWMHERWKTTPEIEKAHLEKLRLKKEREKAAKGNN